MATSPAQYKFPQIFKRLFNQKDNKVKHLIDLRESKAYRQEKGNVLVQGLKTIRELRNDGFRLESLIVTAKKDPYTESEIKFPALQALQNPDAFRAKNLYLVDVDLTRRILGTASRPGRHELFAEVQIPKMSLPDKKDINRLLVFDHVNDPGNLGTLVRTAKGLGWSAGLTTTGTCDMYNDKTIRASRALSLKWPFELVGINDLVSFLKTYEMTPVVADMMPPLDSKYADDLWSPSEGKVKDGQTSVGLGSGLWFWNFQGKAQEVPKRVALILSSEHNGAQGLDDELRVSIPMDKGVESLNVASAGSMLMYEFNRLLAVTKGQ
ncbi:Alpha/beta knot methyltransferase [Phycomyces nitens]|nr:Alpha/beta knot methyltransferase [Phycomyces nitens]